MPTLLEIIVPGIVILKEQVALLEFKRNCIIGQSGGPTIAINASLAGIIHRAKASQEFENVYGMINGIKGLLEGRYMDLLSSSKK